jgi:hypothetical protein
MQIVSSHAGISSAIARFSHCAVPHPAAVDGKADRQAVAVPGDHAVTR